MKSALPFIVGGGGVAVATAVAVFVFGDQLGLVDKPMATAPVPAVLKTEAPIDPPKPEIAKPASKAPSFDVVRVEPDGRALVAGRAEPGWVVELKNGAASLSTVVADANGEWVMILEDPLGEGVSDLSLTAKSEKGGGPLDSEASVTVARPKDGEGELLVVESTPGKASKVLANIAKPDAKAKPLEVIKAPTQPAGQVPEKAEEIEKIAPPTKAEPEAPAVPETETAEQTAEQEPLKEEAVSQSSPQEDVNQVALPQKQEDPAKDEDVAQTPLKQELPVAPEVAEQIEEVADVVADKSNPLEEPAQPAKEVAIERSLAIEAVEIEGDRLFVAGAAEPAGSILRLYVDNQTLSGARSGQTGRFLFEGNRRLEPGEHMIRVDLLNGETGKVEKRAEVSFVKNAEILQSVSVQGVMGDRDQRGVSASGEAGPVKTQKVIIRRGDNLWTIARRVYGEGIRFSAIYDNNTDQIRDPNWIYPGQVFELPHGENGWDNNFDAIKRQDVQAGPRSVGVSG